MPFKLTPDELNPDSPNTKLSLSLQRNEQLVKQIQRQLEHEGRIPRDDQLEKRKSHRKSTDKRQASSSENSEDKRRRSERKSRDREAEYRREKSKSERKSRDWEAEFQRENRKSERKSRDREAEYRREKSERKSRDWEADFQRENRKSERKSRDREAEYQREKRKSERSSKDKETDDRREDRRTEGQRVDKQSADNTGETKTDEKKVDNHPTMERTSERQRENKRAGNRVESQRVESKPVEGKTKKSNEIVPIAEKSDSAEELSVTRVDAVVFVVVLAEIVACLAIAFEIYAYVLDQQWNDVMKGVNPIPELDGHSIFQGKTFKLDGHEYLRKALEYATRDEAEEYAFMIIIVLFVGVTFAQLIACYVKAPDVETYAVHLVALYALGGALLMFSTVLLVTASTKIENRFSYAADMLHNFRHLSTDEPISSQDQDKCYQELKNGCDYYEFAKMQALFLERIFRQCGSGSRFTRYYKTDTSQTAVQVFDETYYRSELKEIGFCSRDGYKFAAAACALIAGMLSAIVPVIFCCESKAEKWQAMKQEVPTPPQHVVPDKDTEKQSGQRQQEKERKLSSGYYPSALIEQFRAYIERDSEKEGSDRRQTPTSKVHARK